MSSEIAKDPKVNVTVIRARSPTCEACLRVAGTIPPTDDVSDSVDIYCCNLYPRPLTVTT